MVNKELIEKALRNIKGLTEYKFFFDNLTKPNWIRPLYEKGLFTDPFEPIRENDQISYPIWPQSRYLLRMADKEDPDTVLDVMLNISETDNVRIHEDFADAACKMQVDLAGKWAKKETGWVEKQKHLYFLLPPKLGNLISHLAKGNKIEIAVNLTRALIKILPDPRYKEISGDSAFDSSLSSPQPTTRFDIWIYQHIIEKNIIPDLVPAAGMEALEMLCELLKDAILIIRGKEGPDDYSYIWRKAIEDHEQNLISSAEDVLVEAVRDVSYQLINKYKKQVFDYLENDERHFKIFKRIAIYLRYKWLYGVRENCINNP